MARKIQEILTDDIDGSTDDVRTVEFAIDGERYEIELGVTNDDKLRAALAPFISAGRRLVTPRRRRSPTGRLPREVALDIRAWVQRVGRADMKIANRGRIAGWIIEEYEKVHGVKVR